MNMFRKNKLRKKRDWKDLIGKQENGNIKKRLNKKKLLKCRVIHNNWHRVREMLMGNIIIKLDLHIIL